MSSPRDPSSFAAADPFARQSGRHPVHASGLSLRLRLMLLLLLVFGVILTAVSIAPLIFVRSSVAKLTTKELTERADRLTERLGKISPPTSENFATAVDADADTHAFSTAVYSEAGKLLSGVGPAASGPGAQAALEAARSNSLVSYTFTSEGKLTHESGIGDLLRGTASSRDAHRLVARTFVGSDGVTRVLATCCPDKLLRTLSDDLSYRLVIATPLWLLASALGGWLVAGIAVRPIHRLSQIAANMSPQTLQAPIELGSRASELTELQGELDQMRQRLETGYAAQERFVANVSHEIKTPIAVVLTEAQTISRSAEAAPEIRAFIQSTQEEMRRLGKLVESFLLLTRVRHGKPLEATTRLVSVNDLVMDSISHCWMMSQQYTVNLEPVLAEESDQPLKVLGDPELLRTMVDNLVRNAIRFAPKNSPVVVKVLQDREKVMVCVSDHGPPVPDALIATLFDRYSQAKGEEKMGRGSGLGLEIAQGIAELHRGRITVSNPSGGGCEFCVTLPLQLIGEIRKPLSLSESTN